MAADRSPRRSAAAPLASRTLPIASSTPTTLSRSTARSSVGLQAVGRFLLGVRVVEHGVDRRAAHPLDLDAVAGLRGSSVVAQIADRLAGAAESCAFGSSRTMRADVRAGEGVGAGEAAEQDAEVGRAGEELLLELDEARQVEEERVVARAGERRAAAADRGDACRAGRTAVVRAGGRRACRSTRLAAGLRRRSRAGCSYDWTIDAVARRRRASPKRTR